MNTTAQAGGHSDLLSSILGVTIRNEEKISEQDSAFCRQQQEELYRTLDQLVYWYDLLKAETANHAEEYRIKFEPNGKVYETPINGPGDGYARYARFTPFEAINTCFERYHTAIERFGDNIIRYFNRTYNVSVEAPYIDAEKQAWGFRPIYQTYVDAVIEHLGGRSFREIAEQELMARFCKRVRPSNWSKVKTELKGDRIVIPDALWYEDYSWQTTLHLSHTSGETLNDLCAGIVFGTTGSLNGGMDSIVGYNHRDVDLSR